MSFFAMSYRVLFHDTMAYGSHHFLTNFKFQCEAREHLYFGQVVDASAEGRHDHESHVLLTQQGYARNLAPVAVGQKVAILVSSESHTLSSWRLCFRVLRADGTPVTCGFQTVVCVSRETGNIVPTPASILRAGELIPERLTNPTFAERVLSGKLAEVFDSRTRALGAAVASADPDRASPRFLDAAEVVGLTGGGDGCGLGRGVVFMFPGQGSYSRSLLRFFHHSDPQAAALLRRADEITRQRLDASLLAAVLAETDAQHDECMARCPDLVQVGIYLGAVLSAQHVRARGLDPDVLVGHSAGELAALAAGGACSLEDGIELVCRRAEALHSIGDGAGGMLAVFSERRRAEALLAAVALPSLELAVVNHDEQAVVSGTKGDLERLAQAAQSLGIESKPLPSPYPFHSRLLGPATVRFEQALRDLDFKVRGLPVYSPIEGAFYSAQDDLPRRLASHLVRHLRFPDAVRKLRQQGARVFVECGGKTLGPFVRNILRGDAEIEVHSPFASGHEDGLGLTKLLEKGCALGLCPAPPEAPAAEADPRDAGRALAVGDAGGRIAIVSLGCVLPGAPDSERFWSNILEGTGGIRDAGALNPELAADFKSGNGGVSDKTYTLLGGVVEDFAPDLEAVPYGAEEFAGLTRAQQFLATALGQCLRGLRGNRPPAARTHVVVGATADGIREFDEALLAAGLDRAALELEADPAILDAFRQRLVAAVGRSPETLDRVAPDPSYRDVVGRLLGADTYVLTVDAACASSLYAIVLGAESLRRGECDLALVGGVFAPGPANGCLFAQFQGLSATGSRPFDASSDGVIFSEGAAFVALRRLPDAIAAGDRIRAVIRGYGLSSDGKSPSAAVPQRKGQILALQRAYAASGTDRATIQYVEAHATSTAVGDAVEFSALAEFFGAKNEDRRPIELASVKALIGHTGWAAGAASVIKMTKALEARVMPPQSNYRSPGANIDLASSPFVISTVAKPWPANVGSAPRRCAVSGFGFGGTNAHVILEAFEAQGRRSAGPRPPGQAPSPGRQLVAVAVAGLFPFAAQEPQAAGDRCLRFGESDLHLPPGIMILPDVADDMDASQVLAVRVAANALRGLGDAWKAVRERTAVVLGFEGKARRAIEVNQRIYLDFLRRRLAQIGPGAGLSAAEVRALLDELTAGIERIKPSGPYTLSGFMPNVAAGRIANVFNLNGPNLVVGAGERSLYEAVWLAGVLLERGTCDLVLAGALNADAGCEAQQVTASRRSQGRPLAEGALLVALAHRETARARGFPVLAELELLPEGVAGTPRSTPAAGKTGAPYLLAAEGALELARALEDAQHEGGSTVVAWPGAHSGAHAEVRVVSASSAQSADAALPVETPARPQPAAPDRKGMLGPEAPIYVTTPRWAPASRGADRKAFTLDSARLLILTDREAWIRNLRAEKILKGLRYTLVCPASWPVPGATAIDLSSDASVAESLRVRPEDYDAVVAIKDLAGAPGLESVASDGGAGGGLLDLAFVCARRFYARLKSQEVVFGTLCLDAFANGRAHPCSGLFGGLIKSLARELPEADLKAVVTDDGDLGTALRRLESEWRHGPTPAAAEVAYRAAARHEPRLVRLEQLALGDDPWLGTGSVVLAAGGGRGVTAVLMEEVLRRFRCRVVLLGRTDPGRVPPEILAMDDAAFAGYEPRFYRGAIDERRGARPAELKTEYEAYRNAREVTATLERLRELPGTAEYRAVDVTRAADVDAALAAVVARYGRLDLVVHGAGLQSSKLLAHKRLEDFRRIVSTKVAGVANLHQACQRHAPAARFHLLTSAFSVLGNDGQSDYGAANEALNRLAEDMTATGRGSWTALAWLGWAGVGMTRGSEYLSLARDRGLKAVTPEEGRELFGRLLSGGPAAAVSVLLSEGEIAAYGVPWDRPAVAPALDSSRPPAPGAPFAAAPRPEPPARLERVWELSLPTHAYLGDHLVNSRPTLPAAFELELAAQAAQALRPHCHVVTVSNAQFPRFVKLLSPAGLRLRAEARVVEESDEETLAHVQLRSDIVHSSGRVLETGVLHFESLVSLSRNGGEIGPRNGGDGEAFEGTRVPDPYLLPGAGVRLDGLFRCLSEIELGTERRRARFRVAASEKLPLLADFLTPALLLDGLFRVSIIHVEPSGAMPLYVPVRGGRFEFVPETNDVKLAALDEELLIVAAMPRVDNGSIHSDWARVTDSSGRTWLAVQDLEGRRVGEVQRGE